MYMFLLEVADLNPKGSQHGSQKHLLKMRLLVFAYLIVI